MIMKFNLRKTKKVQKIDSKNSVFYKQDKDFPNYRKIAELNKSETDFSGR